MNQTEFARYVRNKQETLENLLIKKRSVDISRETDLISTIIGPRRCGKSYLMFYLMRGSENWLYLNFEDVELAGTEPGDILRYVEYHCSIFGQSPDRLFLDEVQTVEDWERAVVELYETKKYSIFVTGSSSKLLAKEIASHLRGRSIKYELFPLSFKEYLSFKDAEPPDHLSSTQESKMLNRLMKYLEFGGFPDMVLRPRVWSRFFEEYIDLVIYRDLVDRYGIKDLALMKHLIKACLASYSSEFSINKLYNTFRSKGLKIGKSTLYNYFAYLEDALFVHRLPKFSWSDRTSRQSIPKIYLTDTGLCSFTTGLEIGRAMENAVFTELRRRGDRKPGTELFYRKGRKGEVDFVRRYRRDIEVLIQVTYEIGPENEKRECAPLIEASEELGCGNILIITWDHEGSVRWKEKEIPLIPLWKWLLDIHSY